MHMGYLVGECDFAPLDQGDFAFQTLGWNVFRLGQPHECQRRRGFAVGRTAQGVGVQLVWFESGDGKARSGRIPRKLLDFWVISQSPKPVRQKLGGFSFQVGAAGADADILRQFAEIGERPFLQHRQIVEDG